MEDYYNIVMDGPKSTQKTVTLDQELWYALDEWLKSKKAKKMGYHSKAQFCTEAVRELLDYHSMNKPSEQKILEEIGMIHREVEGSMEKIDSVEYFIRLQMFLLHHMMKEGVSKEKLRKATLLWEKKNKLEINS